MFKKFVATAATLFIAASLSLVGVAGSASATEPDGTTPSPVAATDVTPAPAASTPADAATPDSTPSAAPAVTPSASARVSASASPSPSPSPSSNTPPGSTPQCIPNSSVSYTYDASHNSGTIKVTYTPSTTGLLCHPFWVTAAAWLYTKDAVWPQVLDTANTQYLAKISTAGTYKFAATVLCGQGDIYASTSSQPLPTSVLNGPNDPFAEHFLHDMGFTGPTPTYVQQATSCNAVTPATPTAKAITTCGTYGAVTVPADTAAVSYVVTGSGNVGQYTVTATVAKPYTLAVGAKSSWTFDLGQYTPCVVYGPSVSYTLGACYPNGTFSSKNLYFHFDNSASNVAVTFTVANTSISDLVAAHATDTVEGTPTWDQGVGYDVFANGVLLSHLTIPSFVGCLNAVPGDPSVAPDVCTDGVVTNGSITVDLQPSLTYSITGVGNAVSIPQVLTASTSLPAGTYQVGVTANAGFVLTGADNWPLTRIVLPPDGCGDFPTLSDQPTNVTSTGASCGSTDGTITVGQVDGVDFTQFVNYSIDGTPVSGISTKVAPGVHTVTAVAVGDNTLDGPDSWTVTIAAGPAACGDLKTLALTGTDDFGWIILAIIMLQLGVGVLAVRAALNRREAQHRIG